MIFTAGYCWIELDNDFRKLSKPLILNVTKVLNLSDVRGSTTFTTSIK
jgi:hypothetical protein